MQSCQKVPKYVKGSLPPLSRYGLKKVRCLDSLRTWQDGRKNCKEKHYMIEEVFLLLLFAWKICTLVPFVWSWLEEKRRLDKRCVKCMRCIFLQLWNIRAARLSSYDNKSFLSQYFFPFSSPGFLLFIELTLSSHLDKRKTDQTQMDPAEREIMFPLPFQSVLTCPEQHSGKVPLARGE